MLEQGYIKLYRSLLRWEWYDDANTFRVFVHLLLTVNHEPQKWHGITIDRGQRLASFSKIAGELRLSVQNIRTSIDHLKSTGEVTCRSQGGHSIFTVVNYNLFQQLTSQPTNSQQSPNKALTNDQQQRKNDKNIEKEKNILPPKSPQGEGQAEDLTVETAGGAAEAAIRPKTPVQGFEEFWKSFPKKASKGSALKAWNKLRPGKELREKIMAAIERAKKSEQWNRENGRFIPYPATWLHAQGWEDELEPQNKAKAQTTYNIEAFEQSGAFDDLDWRP
ncbi:MAG: hypothetical protein ACLVLJ_00940 [Hydrogeniiclostridium mannosilyticum]